MIYIDSKHIRIFPCRARGKDTTSDTNAIYDVESALTTEKNLTQLANYFSSTSGGKGSFVLSEKLDSKLPFEFYIGGYYVKLSSDGVLELLNKALESFTATEAEEELEEGATSAILYLYAYCYIQNDKSSNSLSYQEIQLKPIVKDKVDFDYEDDFIGVGFAYGTWNLPEDDEELRFFKLVGKEYQLDSDDNTFKPVVDKEWKRPDSSKMSLDLNQLEADRIIVREEGEEKEVATKDQTITRVYNSLEEIDSNFDKDTPMVEIFDAMVDNSIVNYQLPNYQITESDPLIYPISGGCCSIYKVNESYNKALLFYGETEGSYYSQIYYGVFTKNTDSTTKWSGWSRIIDDSLLPYSKVIRTQTEFDELIKSPTWLDAESVALVGQFIYDKTDNSGIKIPDTVKQIHGFNGAKITITNFKHDSNSSTAKGGLWYATRPTTLDYSIRNLEVDCTGGAASYGFSNCTNLTNCTGTGAGTSEGFGFRNCTNLTNCTGTGTGTGTYGYGYGIYDCMNLTNCTGTGTGTYGSSCGFSNCTNLTNCTGTGTVTYGYGYGFFYCTNVTNCTGTGSGTSEGYGFYDITTASNCKDGGSFNGMWGGTNKNIGIDNSSDQTISGVKTYTASPKVPTTPSGSRAAVAKSYVDGQFPEGFIGNNILGDVGKYFKWGTLTFGMSGVIDYHATILVKEGIDGILNSRNGGIFNLFFRCENGTVATTNANLTFIAKESGLSESDFIANISGNIVTFYVKKTTEYSRYHFKLLQGAIRTGKSSILDIIGTNAEPETSTPSATITATVDGLTPYDKVIRTQTEFEELISSSNWLGAKSVALVGQFTLNTANNSGIKVPATVKQIHGYNGAKITVTNFVHNVTSAKGGLWYDKLPTTNDYSIRDLEVDCTGTYIGYGIYNCTNLTNCTGTGTGNAGGAGSGFGDCTNLTNCTGTGTGDAGGPGHGFAGCTNLTNCTGTGTGTGADYTYGYGFAYCTNLTNCTGTGKGAGADYTFGYGFRNCTNLTNCTGTGKGAGADYTFGYGFYNITTASNCKDGGSTTAMWDGVNYNIDVETCRKKPVEADKSALNAS